MAANNGPARTPCVTCPYRRDVASGVWEREEYEKLPRYDGPTMTQPPSAFYCHAQNGRLCSGWVGCHDMNESHGLRVGHIVGHLSDEDVNAAFDYECPVPLFGSGAEAAEHGLRDVETPGREAIRAIKKVTARRERRGTPMTPED